MASMSCPAWSERHAQGWWAGRQTSHAGVWNVTEGRIEEGDVGDLVRAPLKMVEGRGRCDGVSDKTVVMTADACGVWVCSCGPGRHHSVDGNSYPAKQWFISHSSKVYQRV